MPGYKYERPKNNVIEVFEGKELERVFESVLQSVFLRDGVKVTKAKIRRVLGSFPHSVLGGNVVIIIEQYPLGSMQAHGKYKDLIYSRIGKTGTQYAKRNTKPRNPRTFLQQANRGKLPNANHAWRALSPAVKRRWNKKAIGKKQSGNNLFISQYLFTH